MEFNKHINVFVGMNAQGKTNLIEAIYMCSTGKSFRTNRDKEIINFEKNQSYIGANIKVSNFEKFIEIKMDRERQKRIRVNKNEIRNYKEFYSGLGIVVFSPEDLKLIKGGPQERRNLVDLGISQIKPVYNYNINRYFKVLIQRNNLLKSYKLKKDLLNLLEVFNMQISKIGTNIIIERNNYIKEVNKLCKPIHNKLTSNKEELELIYNPNVNILEDKIEMEKKYLELLNDNLDRDLEYGSTVIGPHRDDILVNINGMDTRIFGSQGQQRTSVLSIKLSEVELIKKERGIYPIFLLDDVFSELDEERRKYLTESFKKMQTFITVTDAVDIDILDDFPRSIFYVESGNIKELR